MTRIAIVTALLALCGGTAFAEDTKDTEDNVTSYEFEDTQVLGDDTGPGTEVLYARQRGPHLSLIRVREHFIPELLKAVQNL